MRPDSLYDLPLVADPRLSPDGRVVAFTVTQADRDLNDYRSAIWLVPSDASEAPRRFTASLRRDMAARWSPDGRRLLFLSTRGGGPPQLYVVPVDGGEATQLTELEEGVAGASWAPDGQWIAFTSIVRDPAYGEDERRRPPRRIQRFGWRADEVGWTADRFRHVFTVRVESGEIGQLTFGPYQDRDPAWAPDSTSLVFASARQPGSDRSPWANDLYLVSTAGDEPRRLTHGGCHYASPSWSPDGRLIACRHLVDLNWPRNGQIAVVDSSDGSVTVLTADLDANCAPMSEQREPIWDGDELVFPVELHGNTHLYRARVDGAFQAEAVLEGDRVIAAHDLKAGVLVHSWHTPTEPAELYIGESRLTHLTQSFRASTPLFNAERFEARAPDGVMVQAWIVRPKQVEGEKRVPLLLSIHGGPFFQYCNGFWDEFQVFAEAGYAVVYANPRGSSGYGEAWARRIAGPFGSVDPNARPDYLDLMAVMDEALSRFDFCDPERVGVIGGSYGGFMTAWIIGHTDRFAAACAERGLYDRLSLLGTTDMVGAHEEAWGGNPYQDLAAVLADSPISYVREMRTPVLLVHAEDDLRCPIGQAEELYTALRTLEREVEFVRFRAGSHSLSRTGPPHQRVARFEIILDWFDQRLKASCSAAASEPDERAAPVAAH